MNYHTFSNLQFRPVLKKIFVVFTLTWETQVVKKYPSYFRYHSSSFDAQESLQHSILA